MDDTARRACEAQLRERFEIVQAEPVPVHKVPQITDVPLIWRYFLAPLQSVVARLQIDEKEYVARTVMHLNTALQGVYVFSSGKNMGTFKAVGYPEDVGRFYRLDSYAGYCWTAHGRYPTNTPGWWGGAHRLRCSTIRSYTTGRSRPMTRTGAIWRCSAIAVRCRPIRRSSPISPTICCGGRG